jgi:hypothetical protein
MSLLQFLNNGYFAGKVGIGTNSPERLLSLYSDNAETTPRLLIEQDGTGDAVMAFSLTSGQGWSMGIDNSGGDAFMIHNSAGGVDSSSQFTILSSGNVGIGMTSPSEKLTVHSTATAIQTLYTTNTQGGYTGYQNSTGGVKGFVGYGPTLFTGLDINNFGLRSQSGMPFATGGGNVRMYINSSGNVGIGTTSPSSQLSIGSNVITTKKPTVVIADGVAGGSLVIRGLSPILSFDRTGASPENKILMDGVGLEFKTGTLDAEGDVDFKINADGDLQLSKGAKISNQENTDIDSAAAEVVAEVSISYTAAFFDFVVKKGTNVRSGTVYACHDGTNVEFTETSTNDLGDTSDVTLSVDISGTNMRLLATVTSDDWSVKSLIRAI